MTLYIAAEAVGGVIDENSKIITVCESRKQALSYVNEWLKAKHLNHFVSWCELHSLEASRESWDEYRNTLTWDDDIRIRKWRVGGSMCAAMARTLAGAVPLGMPWEEPAEVDAYREGLTEKQSEVHDSVIEELKKTR